MMMNILVLGGIAGGALAAAVALMMPTRPRLGYVHSAQSLIAQPVPSAAAPGQGGYERLGEQLLRKAGGLLRVPAQDLAVLERTPAAHVGRQAGLALGVFVLLQLLAGLTALSPVVPVPVVVPVGGSLVAAVLVWFGADAEARRDAAARRVEFRLVVASLLERAALTRAANVGPLDALARVAEVGDSWPCRQIREALERERMAGGSPWQALADLADTTGVKELSRPAQSFQLAGEASATVQATLQAQAYALRSALATDAKARANVVTERMVWPVAGLTLTFMVAIGYPAFVTILSAT
ncbi:type II secretion system F family protein [Streptomyces sp. SM12]|uniref:type II secretion system F family protein n=1 Tax=Streptomyces sp. SM12 TaxID=1071602 RepID=UPI000CD573E8|nr:type II secretion system F family protein [Streptomyces sp. SM12]